jgi:hypothetical protein
MIASTRISLKITRFCINQSAFPMEKSLPLRVVIYFSTCYVKNYCNTLGVTACFNAPKHGMSIISCVFV